jgi:hypothetical protein
VANSLDVKPIVARAFAGQQAPHVGGGLLYDVSLVHEIDIWFLILWFWFFPLESHDGKEAA